MMAVDNPASPPIRMSALLVDHVIEHLILTLAPEFSVSA